MVDPMGRTMAKPNSVERSVPPRHGKYTWVAVGPFHGVSRVVLLYCARPFV